MILTILLLIWNVIIHSSFVSYQKKLDVVAISEFLGLKADRKLSRLIYKAQIRTGKLFKPVGPDYAFLWIA
jgi:hypothetical protein